MLQADDPNPLCASCRTTTLIPDLSVPGHAQAGLPLSGHPASPLGPQLHFLVDVPGADKPVPTGHDSGTITVNLAEADDATRAARRAAMHEPYRTLLGHLRHESVAAAGALSQQQGPQRGHGAQQHQHHGGHARQAAADQPLHAWVQQHGQQDGQRKGHQHVSPDVQERHHDAEGDDLEGPGTPCGGSEFRRRWRG